MNSAPTPDPSGPALASGIIETIRIIQTILDERTEKQGTHLMTHDEMIEVITTERDRKGTVQLMPKSSTVADWKNKYPSQPFDFNFFIYRVKPEPREYWINVYEHRHDWCVHNSRAEADEGQTTRQRRIDCIHVREVQK